MDHVWSPWRYKYLTGAREAGGCIFCSIASTPPDDDVNLVVRREKHNFIVLNRYPYTSGHLMVVPYAHESELGAISAECAAEMMLLARTAEVNLRGVYRPDGMNLGMNLGESAGAGVAGHIHLHVLPRWAGDTNFMTTVGETRVLPEELSMTLQRLRAAFNETEKEQS